jgi:glycosyltransferase involved in cell wall biosynthesis
MKPDPRVTFIVHGGPNSIEAVRARGLARRLDPQRTRFCFRTGSRAATAAAWRRELDAHPADLLYVLNTALPGAVLAPWWSVTSGQRYVLDTGDAVFEMAKRSGVGAGLKLPLLWFFEQAAQRRAAAIVVRGTRHRELLLERGLRRVEVIRDGFAEQAAATPAAVAALRRRLSLDDEFVLGVMGSTVWSPRLQICYGWDLLEALAQLRDQPVKGLIIGDGNGLAWLRQRAAALGVLDRVVFTGRIPYDEVPVHLRVMDVAMSTQTDNLPGRVRTTGKLPEYMAAECFILASRVGEAALVLPELMLLDFDGEVDRGYPQRVADRVRLLCQSRELLEIRRSLPGVAHQLCDYNVLSGKLADLVRQLA